MSTRRISKTVGWCSPSRLEKGPNGRALCRWCRHEVPVGRRTFCSDNCVHEHKLRTNPGYVRKKLFERDRGVCAICGLDTVIEEQRCALRIQQRNRPDNALMRQEFKERLGANLGARRTAGYWDADHATPVVVGGGECGLDGYRTLCIPCHKRETTALRKKLRLDSSR